MNKLKRITIEALKTAGILLGTAGMSKLLFQNVENQKVKALDLEADDFITKPFGTSELLARIRAALRHHVKRQSKAEKIPIYLKTAVS